MILVHPSVERVFKRYSEQYEGRERKLYRCVEEWVTIGAGCIADPVELALELPLRRPDGTLATRDEIRAEWEVVKYTPDLGRLGAREARKHTRLSLSDADLDALTWKRFRANVTDLAKRYPGFPAWPASAQLATIGMAWALGTEKLWRLFVRWRAAVTVENWAGAAAECKILETNNAGVVRRNIANRALFLHAASGIDPEEIPAWVGYHDEAPTVPPPEPEPTDRIPTGEVTALVAETGDQLARDLLAEGYRRR